MAMGVTSAPPEKEDSGRDFRQCGPPSFLQEQPSDLPVRMRQIWVRFAMLECVFSQEGTARKKK